MSDSALNPMSWSEIQDRLDRFFHLFYEGSEMEAAHRASWGPLGQALNAYPNDDFEFKPKHIERTRQEWQKLAGLLQQAADLATEVAKAEPLDLS